ncbi:DUF4347 domain-containing protein, partial [Ramlibacter sp.]|uniref:DUF4347 domain-containing protein n=1 Tax=Ramlibacter sp. TaxID=1917967 RepID=UPI002D30B4FD
MSKKVPKKRRSRLLALEPRVLFDGALVDTAAALPKALDAAQVAQATDAAAHADLPADLHPDLAALAQLALATAGEAPVATGAPAPVEWLIIDGRVPDASTLASQARPGMQVLVLDPSADGLAQIRQALAADGRPADVLHIVSHGAPGFVRLGSTNLDAAQLEGRAADLAAIGASLTASGDLLLYGCDVASTAVGERYVDRLGQLTGADVAASRDATGGAARNGNWLFEYSTGAVTALPFLSDADGRAYGAVLPTIDLAGNTGWTPLLYGSRQDPAGDMQAAAASTDVVGDHIHPTLFYAYDDGGTDSEADDGIMFRFRVSGPNSQGRFGAYGIIGIDADLNGDVDIFLIADDKQGATVGLYNPGAGLNQSPSTTSYTAAPGRIYTLDASNYAFTAVGAGSEPPESWDGNTDIDQGGKLDYFVSFRISFADLKAELARTNVTGNPAEGIAIDRFSPLRFILATATQDNSLNGDIGGVIGANKSTLTWEQLGAYSPVVSASNSPPIITSGGGGQTASYTVAASATQVATITSRDPDGSDTLRYEITGGADAGKFTIDAITGVLSLHPSFTPSVTAPTDADGDGRYEVTVGVRDYSDAGATQAKGGLDTQDLLVSIVAEPDNTRPELDLRTGITPADGATGIAPNANLFMRFSEAVQPGTGYIYIRHAGTGAIVRQIDVNDRDQVRFSGNTVSVNPIFDLAAGTAYYVEISATAFQDLAGNTFVALDSTGGAPLMTGGAPAGVNDTDPGATYKWNFTTGSNQLNDGTPPTLVSSALTRSDGSTASPADNATNVSVTSNLVLNFSEAVFPDNGYIEIRRSSDGALEARISSADTKQVGYSADGKTLTINPVSDLDQNTDYYVVIEGTALQDGSGNRYAGMEPLNQGVSSAYPLNFKTGVDTVAPTVSGVSAANLDGTWIQGDTIFVTVRFSEQVYVTGTPQLQLQLAGGVTRTVNYVSGSGADTLIFSYAIQPGDSTPDLDYVGAGSLTLNGGSIKDSAGNNANLALPAPGSASSLGGQKDLVIDMAPVNTLPALLSGGNNLPMAIAAGVADSDSPTLTVTLTATQGTLSLGTVTGLTFTAGDGTDDTIVQVTGTQAQLNAALATLSFMADAGYEGAGSVTMETTDGKASINGVPIQDTDVLTLDIRGPVPGISGLADLGYVENDPATAVAPLLSLSGPATLEGATVQITGNYQPSQDLLAFVDQGGITGSFDAVTGTLTLTGSASLAQYQAALRSVTYRNTSETPSSQVRTLSFVASSAGDDSVVATLAIDVIPVDDAPTLTLTVGNPTFNQGGAPVALFADATFDTIEAGQAISALVLAVGNVRNGASEVLSINGQDIGLASGSLTVGGVTYAVVVSGNTATVTVSGLSLTPAGAKALVEGITYSNNAVAPIGGNRTVTVTQLQDSGSSTLPDRNTANLALASTVRVVTLNAPPALGGGNPTAGYVENGAGTAIHTAITLSDVDNAMLTGASVAITGGFVAGQDVLAFTNQSGIVGSYDAATGVLTLSGTASVAAYQAALRSVSYRNASDAPGTADRTVRFTVTDGINDSDPLTSTVTVTAVNDAPAGADRTLTILQGASYAFAAADFGFSDATDGGAHALAGVLITSLPATGTLTLNGSPVVAGVTFVTAAQLASGELLYTPAGTATASFGFQVRDSGGTANGGVDTDPTSNVLTLEVGIFNVAPVLGGGSPTAAYVENGTGVVLHGALSITDPDSANMTGAIVRISGNFAPGQDVLNFTDQNGITGVYNSATGVLTLSGSATRANWEAALRSITYSNSSDSLSTATRAISWSVSDGVEFSEALSSSVTVAAVNDAPVLTSPAVDLAYVQGGAPLVVNGSLLVSDLDNATLSTATVSISANRDANDRLSFSNDGSTMGNITGSYDAATGVLSLSSAGGTAILAEWQAALRSVTFDNTGNPGTATRTLTFRVNDGAASSNLLASQSIDTFLYNEAPVLGGANAWTFNEGDSATAVNDALTITDNGSTLAGAVVRISGYVAGEDVLAFTDQNGITGNWDATTGVLTLTGSASVANYQDALRSITYANSNTQAPTAGARTVSFQVDDGQAVSNLSGEALTTITVAPVNDTPTTAGRTISTSKGGTYVFTVADFPFNDVDSKPHAVIAQPSGDGFLQYSSDGVNFSNYTAGTEVTYEDIALGRLRFVAHNGAGKTGTISFTVRDDSGDPLTNTSSSATITITNNGFTTPTWTNTNISAKAFTEGGAAVALVDASVSLSAGTTYTTAVIGITANFVPGQDLLSFTHNTTTMGAGTITVTYSGGTLTLFRASGFTNAQMAAAIKAVTYSNSSESPDTATRTFAVQVLTNDAQGNWSAAVGSTLTVAGLNDLPTLTSSADSLDYTPGSPAPINPWIRLSDLEGGLDDATAGNNATATITLANPQAGDTLDIAINAATMGNIELVGSPGSVLTLRSLGATATLAEWEAALRAVTFNASGADTTVRTVNFVVNDGTANSGTLATTINIGAAAASTSPPVLSIPATLDYVENDPAAVISGSLTIADSDSSSLAGATVRIANFVAGQDVLSFTDQNGITGSFDAVTGVLTLSGSATVADYQAALRSIRYANTSDHPDTTARTVVFQVSDGSAYGSLSNPLASTINVTAVNDAPTLSAPSPLTFNDNQAPQDFFAVTGVLTAADADGPDAIYGIAGGVPAGAGAPTGMDVERVGTYGTLYLNSATGAYSFVPNDAAINAVQAGANPSENFSFTVSDGAGGSDSRTLTVNVVGANDSPIVASDATTATYVEDAAGVAVNTVITLSDADNANLSGATVSITGGFQPGQDVLVFTDQNGITGSYDAGTGVLTLSGSSSVANYQAALRSVLYRNASQDPVTAGRTISFQVDDGGADGASNVVASSTVAVVSVNDAPVLANGGTVGYAENGAPVPISASLGLTDLDSTNLQSATVWIQNFVAGQDVLGFVDQNGISGSWDAVAGVLTLTGTASLADYQAALRSITYANGSDNPSATPRAIRYQVSDGTETSNTLSATVNVTPANDLPVLGGGGGNLDYVENGAAAPIDGSITVADLDSEGLASATVSITAGHVASQDVLSFVNDGTMGNIAASFDAATGVLTLTSASATATPEEWQAALRAVAYRNSSEDPAAAARTISYTVNDGSGNSNTVTATVTVQPVNDAPVLGGVSAPLGYTENGAAVVVDSALTLSDLDDAQMAGATVRISVGFTPGEDQLVFTNQSGITGSWNAATGVLTLSGVASVADYQAALRSITYSNTSEDPSTAPRTVTFEVTDGTDSSNVRTGTVLVTAVNDAPVLSPVGHSLDVMEDAGAPAGSAVGIAISSLVAGQQTDVDGTQQGVAITGLDFTHGRWYFTSDNGASWVEITAAPSDGSVLLLSAEAGNRLYFRPADHFNGAMPGAVTFRAWDRSAGVNGGRFDASVNGGSSPFSAATDVIDVSVTAVNDAPVGTDNVIWVAKNGEHVFGLAEFGFSDPDDPGAGHGFLAVQVTVAPAAGAGTLLRDTGSGWVAVGAGEFVSAADIAAGKLKFAAAPGETGLGLGFFKFKVQDSGGTADAGVDLDTTERAMLFNVGSQEAPTLSGGNNLVYEEQTPPVPQVVNPNISVFDVDNATLESGQVIMSLGFVSGEDVLAFTNDDPALYGNITASWDEVNGILNLTSAGGTATHAQWEAAFRAVTYINQSDAPDTVERFISFIVNDGTQDSNVVTATITVDRENDAPTLSAPGGGLAYVENQAPTAIDTGIVIADPDLPFTFGGGWLQVAFTSGSGAEDRLTVLHAGTGAGQIGVVGSTITYEGNVIGSIDATLDGVGGQSLRINLTAGASVAATQALARAIAYSNVSDAPSTADRTVVYTLNDGGNTGTGGPQQGDSAAITITVTPVNDSPSGTDNAFSLKQGTQHVFGPAEFGFSDPLEGHGFAGVVIGSLPAGGTLERWDGSGWVAVVVGDFVDMSGNNLRFTAGGTPASSSFSFQVRDSGGTADGGVDTDPVGRTMGISVTAGDPPVLGSAGNTAYTEDDGAVGILPLVTVSDDDSASLKQATITITGGYANGQDLLAFTGTANIGGSFDAGTGTLTLTGVASKVEWQQVLRSVTYQNTSNAPSTATRTVSVVLQDDEPTPNNSSTVNLSITVAARNDAPALADVPGLSLDSVLEDAGAPSGAVGTSVADLVAGQSDVDGAGALKGIAITALGGTGVEGGTWYYTTNNGLSWMQVGSAPGEAAALLLAADGNSRLYYRPGADLNGLVDPAVTFRAWDRTSGSNGGTADTGGANNGGTTAFSSATATAAITVTSVADAPVGTSGTITLLVAEARPLTAADFGFSDPGDSPADAFDAVLITSVLAGGTLTFDGVAVTATLGSPLVVSAADLAAGKLVYTAGASAGSASFKFLVRDDGDTSTGGANTDTTERTLTLATYDSYPPVLAGGSTLAFIEGQGPQVVNGVLTLSDNDGTDIDGAVIRIASGYVQGQDVLDFTAVGAISGSFDASTGELVLSGTGSLAEYQAVLRSVTFHNNSDDPSGASRTIRFTVTDADGNTSAALDSTVTVTPVNDAPTLTVGGSGGTFTEGTGSSQGAAVNLFTGAVTSTVESGQNIIELTLTATGLQDGSGETLYIDGTQISLGATGSGTTATNGFGYTVTLGGGGTATIVLSKPAGVSPSVMSALVNGLQYQNTNVDSPTEGGRTFTITQLRDSGGVGSGGLDTTSLGVVSSIGVTALNDAPVLGGVVTGTVAEDGTLTASGTLTITDADASDNPVGFADVGAT